MTPSSSSLFKSSFRTDSSLWKLCLVYGDGRMAYSSRVHKECLDSQRAVMEKHAFKQVE